MFTVNMKKGHLHDLSELVYSIPPKEIDSIKEMKNLSKLRAKLAEPVVEVSEIVKELRAFIDPLRKAGKTPQEMDQAADSILVKLNEKRTEETSVELSDDNIELLRKWFKSSIRPNLVNMEICLLLAEAIGIDTEKE